MQLILEIKTANHLCVVHIWKTVVSKINYVVSRCYKKRGSAIVTKSPNFNMDFMIKSRRPGLNRYPDCWPEPLPLAPDDIPSQTTRVISPRSHRSGRGSTCGWEAGIVSMVVPQTFWPPSMPHFQLVVEPTHLTNILVKVGSSSPRIGVNTLKIFELPPTRLFFWHTHFPNNNAWQNDQVAHFAVFFYKLHFRFQSVAPRMSRDSTHWKAAKCRIFQIPQQDVQSKEHCWHNSIGTTHLTKL